MTYFHRFAFLALTIPIAQSTPAARHSFHFATPSLETRTLTVQSLATIHGRVTESETGEGIPGAHVFLAFSMKGTITDREGWYEIGNIHPHPHQLVVSMIGYEPYSLDVDLHATPFRRIDVMLQRAVYELDQIEVTGHHNRAWRREFARFRRSFIGTSPFARETEIINPYVLDFERNELSGEDIASAAEPLIIHNNALGYRITYVLVEFNYSADRLRWIGMPYFEELDAQTEAEARRWLVNREKAFKGSLQHFLWSIYHDEDGGFALQEHMLVQSSPARPRIMESVSWSPIERRALIQGSDDGGRRMVNFRNHLKVVFKESDTSRLGWLTRTVRERVTWLNLEAGPVFITEDGYHAPPFSLTWFGDMGSRRIAEFVPREYAQGRVVRGND